MIRRLLRRGDPRRWRRRHPPLAPAVRRNTRRGLLYRLHRWVGIAAALFLLWVAVSGIAINHAHSLGLDRQPLRSRWLLDLYGIDPGPLLAVPVAGHWLLWQSGTVSLDGRVIAEEAGRLLGAVEHDGMTVAAAPATLWLLGADGELIDALDASMLPGTIERIGIDDGDLVVQSDGRLHVADAALLGWRAAGPRTDVSWAAISAEPPDSVVAQAPGSPISVERLLLDLHSGRLFGIGGTLFADLIALALVWLIGSGLWNTRRRRT